MKDIESPGSDGPTFPDLVWVDAPFNRHEKSVKAVQLVADYVVDEDVYSNSERDAIIIVAEGAEEELVLGFTPRATGL